MSSYIEARIDYGVNLKTIKPSITIDEIDEFFRNIRSAMSTLKTSLTYNPVLDYKGYTSQDCDDSVASIDIIFFIKPEETVVCDLDPMMVKLIDFADLTMRFKSLEGHFLTELGILLKALKITPEAEFKPTPMLSLNIY